MTPSVGAHLLEGHFCQISPRSDVNRRRLNLFLKNKKQQQEK